MPLERRRSSWWPNGEGNGDVNDEARSSRIQTPGGERRASTRKKSPSRVVPNVQSYVLLNTPTRPVLQLHLSTPGPELVSLAPQYTCTSTQIPMTDRDRPCRLVAVLVALALCALDLAAAEKTGGVTYKQVRLEKYLVSLPNNWTSMSPEIPVWIHLHGAPAVLESNFVAIGAPGVLVNLTLPGLSKVYADHFADPRAFSDLLRDLERELQSESAVKPWKVGRLTVSSFSAGFGGVRQLLRQDDAFGRIDALVMADSIYCGTPSPHKSGSTTN